MAMRIDILTLFPEMFPAVLGASIIGRARRAGVVDIRVTDIRDYSTDRHRKVDDNPFGGGPGMVMMCQPVFDAVEAVRADGGPAGKVALLSPQGRRLDQQLVEQLADQERLILVAGHYEGFDERIRTRLADTEISLGDFVCSGGELPSMVVVDAVVRLLPGALGEPESARQDSFSSGLLDYPHYTRPRDFRGMQAPDVLLSGDHARIDRWRQEQARQRTRERRPDLWEQYERKRTHPGQSERRPGSGEES
jgi:tRNA (guanine37-N1)-methyltransferase